MPEDQPPIEDPSLSQLLDAEGFNWNESQRISSAVAVWLRSWVGMYGRTSSPDMVLTALADDLEEHVR